MDLLVAKNDFISLETLFSLVNNLVKFNTEIFKSKNNLNNINVFYKLRKIKEVLAFKRFKLRVPKRKLLLTKFII